MDVIIYSFWETKILISRSNSLYYDVCFSCHLFSDMEADIISVRHHNAGGMIHSTCIIGMCIDNVVKWLCEHKAYSVFRKMRSIAFIECCYYNVKQQKMKYLFIIYCMSRILAEWILLSKPSYTHFVDICNNLWTYFTLQNVLMFA